MWLTFIAAAAFCLSSAGAASALAAPPQPVARQTAGTTMRVRVRMVAQAWAATATAAPRAPGPKQARFIGHFPGYAAAKDAANARLKNSLRSAAKETPSTAAATLATSSTAMVVFGGPGQSDTRYIPPDPQIAAGPNDVVVAINTLLAIYDKTGAQQGGFQDLSTFFSSLNVTGGLTDPRLVYDQADGRYLLSIDEVDFKNFTNGHVLLAVSATSDPAGVWYKYAIDFMGRNPANTANSFPDFPGLGLSSTAVYLTSNQFVLNSQCLSNNSCAFSDAWIKAIGLPDLLAGNSTLSITTFENVQTAGGHQAFSIQPAVNYGAPSAEFLIAADFSANPGTLFNLFSITTSGTPALASADLAVPSFSMPSDAPQPGSGSLIMTDDFRILNAVWSNGSLWCGQNVAGGNGQPVGRWYQIALTDLTSPSLTQSGDVTGVGSAYYPELGVESGGAVAMTFTTSSSYVAASAAYTGRESADAAGTTRSFSVYLAGSGPYDESLGNRWGDYSGISLDPSGTSFWGIAEYAGTPDPHFGTEIAQIAGDPSLSVAPGSFDFSGLLVGSSSSAQSFTFTNVSANTVVLGNAAVSGAYASDFVLSSDQCSGLSLAAGQSCTASVTFTPSQQASETAALSLAYDGGSVVAGLHGIGLVEPVLNLSPASLDFGAVPEQEASAPQVVTLTNTGNEAAQLSNISIYVPFVQTNTCGASLAAGASCRFTVTFYPLSATTYQARLTFMANPTQTQFYSVPLTGTGVAVPFPVLCPASLAFGNQIENTPSAAQTVILTNSGAQSLTVTAISTTGDFAETNNCGGSVAPRGDCRIDVTFTPTVRGTETGTLTITDDATGSPQTVTLSGSGVATTAAADGTSRAVAVASAFQSRARTDTDAATRLIHVDRPISFAPNVGQFRPGLRYVARVPGYAVAVTRRGLELEMQAEARGSARSSAGGRQPAELVRLQMRLVDANPKPAASGEDELPGKSNYFFGRDPRAWRTDVPTYAKVSLRDVYPGVDLVYYGNQRRLEYDFAVRPGANPGRIRMNFAGASQLRVDAAGDLLLGTRAGVVHLHKPVVYQASAGTSRRVYRRGNWVVEGKTLAAFRVGPYDRKKTLVIDPVLSFSTYLGGSGGDMAFAIAVDGQDSAYVAGGTYSSDFPVTSGSFQQTCATCSLAVENGFVAKLSADGSKLLYSTYLVGSRGTEIHGIAVDSAGDAYVTGPTSSSDFPTTSGAFEPQCTPLLGPETCSDSFVTKVDPTGSSLLYSTYLGGTGSSSYPGDSANAIAVDASGDAWVGGASGTADFPTTAGAYQTANHSLGTTDGFLSELNPSGAALLYSTLIGGSDNDVVNGVAVDGSGNAYVAGAANSLDFPTTAGALQQGSYGGDVFVAKFSATGSLVYSTLLGGSQSDAGAAIAVDSAGAAFVTGQTHGDFPVTAGAFQTTPGPLYVAKIHPQGCALEYSTYLPGGGSATAESIALDQAGDAYLAGTLGQLLNYSSFPTVNPVQPVLSNFAPFIAELNPQGTAELFSTSLGGSQGGWAHALAVDSQGDIYVTGLTNSLDFPAANALQPSNKGVSTAFVAKISPGQPSPITLTRSSLTFKPIPIASTQPDQESVGLMNNQSVNLNIQSVTVSGAGYSLPTSSTPCTGSLAPGAGCVIGVQFDPTATGSQPGTVTVTDDGPGSPRQITLNGTGLADFAVSAEPLAFNTVLAGTDSNGYYVYVNSPNYAPAISGDVTLSCSGVSPATCTFNPSSVPVGSTPMLTVGNLTAISGDSLSFSIEGTAGAQTASAPVQITIQDFSLSAPTTAATVTAGQNAAYSMSVAPINGFNDAITFSCSGLPTAAACSFSPTPAVMDGKTTLNETIAIVTTARSGAPPPGSPDSWPAGPRMPSGWWALACAILLLLAFCSATLRRRKFFLPVLLLLALAASVSCGGGGGGISSAGGGSGVNANGTPAGTYSVTVTGAYKSAIHTVKISLTVQ